MSTPLPWRRERAQGAKLDPREMETEMKTGAATRTQDRRGRDRNGGKVKDGDRAGPTQGPKWTRLQHRVGGVGQREAQVSTEPSWERGSRRWWESPARRTYISWEPAIPQRGPQEMWGWALQSEPTFSP